MGNDGGATQITNSQSIARNRQTTVPQRLSDDVRARFINLIQLSPGKSIASAAVAFGIPKSTAYDINKRFVVSGNIFATKKGGAFQKKMTPAIEQALLDWVDNEADTTLKTLAERILNRFGIAVSQSTVSRALSRNGFTLKLLRQIPESRNSPEVIAARKDYANVFMRDQPIDRKCIVWVDETGFNLHLRRKYGRALAGLRANVVVANSRGANISICAAMSEEGLLVNKVHRGSYTAVLFVEFLELLFARLDVLGRTACWVILDNVRFHHCTIVADCATKFGHCLVFLPPYSPMLNPIESLFGKWKASVRSRHVVFTPAELLSMIELGRNEITTADCLSWIRDSNRNIALSLQNHFFD